MKYLVIRGIFSLLLILASLFCFIISPSLTTTTRASTITAPTQEQHARSVEIRDPGIAKFLEWIGLGSLVFAVWLWRKELAIDGFGPIRGSKGLQQEPGGIPEEPTEESVLIPAGVYFVDLRVHMDTELKDQAHQIMQMFNKYHSINATSVARDLEVDSQNATAILFDLVNHGILRVDGLPENAIYTPTNSIENRTLDAVRLKLTRTYDIVSERRFVLFDRKHEIDSLMESDDCRFVVEAKVLTREGLLPQLSEWVNQLVIVTSKIRARKIMGILALGCKANIDVENARKQVESVTFETGAVPIRVWIFAQSDLSRHV